jgi:nickel superoxide dismutase
MNKLLLQLSIIVFALLLLTSPASSHCEIPCGIYDDQMRITLLKEHISTIEKSMDKINNPEDGIGSNQHVRWIMNKEDHANQFQEIVSQYFLTQRIKPDNKDYTRQLELLHQMLVYAMKCKQTTNLENTTQLKELVDSFEKLYFAPHK